MMRRRQGGFTLVELAFAGLIAAGLSIVALELLLTSFDLKRDLDGRLRTNAAARQTMGLLADGGFGGPGAGTDGTTAAHGLRGRAGPPAIALADGEVLEVTSNGLVVAGDRASPVDIVCVAAGDPAPVCPNAGATVTLNGAVAAAPRFQDVDRSIEGRTVEVEVFVRDPWAAARGHGRVERFGAIHIYNAVEGEGAAGAAADPVGTDP